MTFHRALTKYNIGSFGQKKERVWTLVHIKKITVMTEVIVGKKKKTKTKNFFFGNIFFRRLAIGSIGQCLVLQKDLWISSKFEKRRPSQNFECSNYKKF